MSDSQDTRYLPTHGHFSDHYVTSDDAAGLVDQVADLNRGLYAPGPRYRLCESWELERTNRWAGRFVRDSHQELERAGFRHLGDVMDVIASAEARWFARPAIIRSLVHADGTMAGLYAVRLARAGTLLWLFRIAPRTIFTIDLETELLDGRFVATSNLLGLNTTEPVPGIVRVQLDPKTALADLLQAHRRTVQQEARGVGVRRMQNLAEVHDSQMRLMEIKRRHKQARGFVSSEEFRLANKGRIDRLTSMAMQEADKRSEAASYSNLDLSDDNDTSSSRPG